MKKGRGSELLLLMLIAFALGALTLMVFDRVTHNDYELAKCSSSGVGITAELIGDYGQDGRQNRASPYRLRLTVDRARNPSRKLNTIRMKSLVSNRVVHLGHVTDQEIDRADSAAPLLVYMGEDLPLDYVDYQVTGLSLFDPSQDMAGVPFTCNIKRHEWSEWRIDWLDRLMSV